MRANVGKQEKYVPKADLMLQEFIAIKHTFSGADFERNAPLALVVPVSMGVLFSAQRLFRRMKWFI